MKIARLAGRPLERFLRVEAASGIVLLMAAAVALVWANSSWSASYFQLWHTPMLVRVGAFSFERSLEWFVNDGLMAIFFFVVGLEIRRELHHGELSEWKRAALPVAAALGGMVAPAVVFLAFARAPEGRSGWGVPMATDIAFAVGILTLLGKRVPPALRVLLLALAVIDDLGAIVVIAIFYSKGISLAGFAVAGLGLAVILVMQRFGVRTKGAYALPAFAMWAGIYAAGVHPTIAGVIVGVVTPVRAWLGPNGFIDGTRKQLDHLANQSAEEPTAHELSVALRHIDLVRREAISPAESLIESLHPWVAFGIMPIFALANAGVSLRGMELGGGAAVTSQVTLGIALGLLLGKPLGILIASILTLRLGFGVLPAGVGKRHLVVLGVVAGVGFTMALFIAQLAFPDAKFLAAAKAGVLLASGGAATLALVLGRLLLALPEANTRIAMSADEAEASTEL